MTAGREMLSDELVEAIENLHQYPRLIAERAAREAVAAYRAALREQVKGLRLRKPNVDDIETMVLVDRHNRLLAAVLALLDPAAKP